MFKITSQILLFVACPTAILTGVLGLADYSGRPGPQSNVVSDLSHIENFSTDTNAQSETSSENLSPTLILFYHPHCPCTVSTARCLERLWATFTVTPKFIAYAYCPGDQPDQWVNSTTTSTLTRIADTQIVVDRESKYAHRFGTLTSGHVLLYNPDGKLVFSGGVTPGRGHEGECLASSDLLQKLNNRQNDFKQWPVFGCQLYSTEAN